MKLDIKKYGENSLILEVEEQISEEQLLRLIQLKNRFKKSLTEDLYFVQSSYHNILLSFKDKVDEKMIDKVRSFAHLSEESLALKNRKLWHIPVCYEERFALDLNELSIKKGLSREEIVKMHTQEEYLLYFMGFLPGFCYLGGLNPQLFHPRKTIPRQVTPKGAVAIGGQQTGVYPVESPGGWHVIGNTPLDLFQSNMQEEQRLKEGDKVQFVSITQKEYVFLKTQVERGEYHLKSIPC